MASSLEKTNYWARKTQYVSQRSAQSFLGSNHKDNKKFVVHLESYDSCGDYDTGCYSE